MTVDRLGGIREMAVSLGLVAAVCLVGCTGTADPSWKSDSPSGDTTQPSEPTDAPPTHQPPTVAERATQIDVVDRPLDWKEVDRYPAVGAGASHPLSPPQSRQWRVETDGTASLTVKSRREGTTVVAHEAAARATIEDVFYYRPGWSSSKTPARAVRHEAPPMT